jgi:cytoskeletal protein CcmA (bactofilin family)
VRGEDRTVLGDSSVIGKSEIVHTVTVAGGSLKVEGIVTGDLVVAGGSAKLVSGARVVGNVVVFGGSLKVEDKARIDGDVAINGGSLKREDGAIIGGSVVNDQDHDHSHRHHGRRGSGLKVDLDDKDKDASDDSATEHHSRIAEAAQSFGSSMTKMALLFVLGCVLLALLAPRMERLRVEIASRPMRAFATGLVGTVLGVLSSAILLTVLCVSVIGIPVAVIAVLLAVLAVYGAIASALTTFGAAVIGHRTQNPYLHLLLGCGAFLVLLSIPWVGWIVAFAVTMIAIGALILTRVGGLLDRRKRGWSDRPAAML